MDNMSLVTDAVLTSQLNRNIYFHCSDVIFSKRSAIVSGHGRFPPLSVIWEILHQMTEPTVDLVYSNASYKIALYLVGNFAFVRISLK